MDHSSNRNRSRVVGFRRQGHQVIAALMSAPPWLVFMGKCLDVAAHAVIFATAAIICVHAVTRVWLWF